MKFDFQPLEPGEGPSVEGLYTAGASLVSAKKTTIGQRKPGAKVEEETSFLFS